MTKNTVLLGRSKKTSVENKARKVVSLPGRASRDFILNARCRILGINGRVSMSAADLPGDPGGTYAWTTTSAKIRLINTTSNTLVIEATGNPSAARDAESITVTRTATNGTTTVKSISVTVVKVVFGPAAAQLYGYDDFDTPRNLSDDHLSVKSNSDTFVSVTIEGGALGTDFNFETDDAGVCTADPGPGAATFDLRIRAKSWQKKSTVLRAKVKCPSNEVFAEISVHVYTEKVVKVLVAKVADSNSAATTLNFPTADYAAHQTVANAKLKEAVVKYEISNFDPGNSVTNIPFDVDSDGAFSFDINAGGGMEFDLINRAVVVTDPDQVRVVIVRNMKSFYYVDRAVRRGATSISLRGRNVFKAIMKLGSGATMETVEVTGNSGNIAHLAAPLTFDHAVGEAMEFPAAGWSTDPILIAEGTAALSVTKWTVLHEVGHTALDLQDIIDVNSFMHFDQSNADNRLRYCPRDSQYTPGVKENQWDKIPRPPVARTSTRAR